MQDGWSEWQSQIECEERQQYEEMKMPFVMKQQPSEFQNPSPGMVSAVLIRIIDMGTQESTYQGETSKRHKILFQWEVDEAMEDGRPFLVSKQFTMSNHEKSNLTKDLTSWHGKLPAGWFEGRFNLDDLLGKPAMLNMVENDKYINVASVSPLPKGMSPLSPQGETFSLSLDPDEFSNENFEKLSDRLKEKISGSPEYQALGAPVEKKEEPSADFSDDIPFN